MAALKQATAKYPIRVSTAKLSPFHLHSAVLLQVNFLGAHFQALSTRVSGYTPNPFNFKHQSVTQVGVYVDDEHFPRKPLILQFDEAGGQNFIAEFQRLFFESGKSSQDPGNQMNRSDCG